jgi:sec-independent protein translocase protein TatC
MSSSDINEDQELSFLEHLVELRSRLLKACLAVLLVLLVLLPFSRKLYVLLAAPLTARLPEGSSALSALGLRSAGALPARKASCPAVTLLSRGAFLRRLCLRVLRGLPAGL